MHVSKILLHFFKRKTGFNDMLFNTTIILTFKFHFKVQFTGEVGTRLQDVASYSFKTL